MGCCCGWLLWAVVTGGCYWCCGGCVVGGCYVWLLRGEAGGAVGIEAGRRVGVAESECRESLQRAVREPSESCRERVSPGCIRLSHLVRASISAALFLLQPRTWSGCAAQTSPVLSNSSIQLSSPAMTLLVSLRSRWRSAMMSDVGPQSVGPAAAAPPTRAQCSAFSCFGMCFRHVERPSAEHLQDTS
jgi:hypothetical protein